MKKLFLASIIAISGAFAQEVAPATAPVPAQAPAATTVTPATPAPVQPVAATTETATHAPAAEHPVTTEVDAAHPVATTTETATHAPAAEHPVTTEATPVAQADSTPAAEPIAEAVPATEPAATSAPEATQEPAPAPVVIVNVIEPEKPHVTKIRAKRVALIEINEFKFDVNASFEIQAGKTFWSSEDEPRKTNLDEWWGRANLGFVAEANDFKGQILLHLYPGDLSNYEEFSRNDDNFANNGEREGYKNVDIFELEEAWAMQKTRFVNFKLGRWEENYKSGDFFGGYLNGYKKGFRSTTTAENQFQFGLTPMKGVDVNVAFISTESFLNKGDLRLMFEFSELKGLENMTFNLGYRTNVFDKVYNSNSDVRHQIALAVKLDVIKNTFSLFAEGALLNIDAQEVDGEDKIIKPKKDIDMTLPVTGGIILQTPVVDRVILEAEYIKDRADTEFAETNKHIKDVLGALYLEKDLTSRFTLSAGFHSFQNSRDFTLSGNLIGRIN
ncbi:MAG: hypothetical protein LBR60_02285 [Fibrobacter sp.]|jgi:hypothetical protein|nr:hypothetical protein [Fibrobacter sp.]